MPDVRATASISRALADQALRMLDVDAHGLDVMDRKLLEAVVHRFDGGPVGLDNVAAAIGEERDTIEDVIEPYLIQQGYLQRTPRAAWRTPAAYRHLGVTPPRGDRQRPVSKPDQIRSFARQQVIAHGAQRVVALAHTCDEFCGAVGRCIDDQPAGALFSERQVAPHQRDLESEPGRFARRANPLAQARGPPSSAG